MKTLDAAREAEIEREARIWALQVVALGCLFMALGAGLCLLVVRP